MEIVDGTLKSTTEYEVMPKSVDVLNLPVLPGETQIKGEVPINSVQEDSSQVIVKDPIAKLVKRMNQKHAVVNISGKCRVMTAIVDPDTGLEDIQFSPPGDFRSMYCNRIISTSSGDKSLGVLWFMHPARREYEGLMFNPKFTPLG